MLSAQNIRKIREFRGFRPPEVINGAKVNKTSYYDWEAGRYGPDAENLDLLSKFFRVPAYVFSMDPLTEDYLEKNFSNENPTPMPNGSDNKEKDEVYRTIVEGGTEYLLIPRSVLQDKYRLRSLEDIEKDNKVLDKLLDAHEKMLTRLLAIDPKFVGVEQSKQNT